MRNEQLARECRGVNCTLGGELDAETAKRAAGLELLCEYEPRARVLGWPQIPRWSRAAPSKWDFTGGI